VDIRNSELPSNIDEIDRIRKFEILSFTSRRFLNRRDLSNRFKCYNRILDYIRIKDTIRFKSEENEFWWEAELLSDYGTLN
jgi:hypothetical protein